MVSLGLDSKDFEKGMGNAEKSSGKFRKGIGTVGAVVAGATAAATGLGVAAFAATKKVTESFDNIAKSSAKLGVSTDAYQEMDYWAGQNGISTGTMERAVGRLNQRMGLAVEGNEKYAGALEKLGVDMNEVREGTVSTEDAMAQSIKTLSEMTNEQEKSALASELFGTKMARDLMPALQDGSMSLEEAKEKAEELGFVIDGETLEAAEHFQDTWDDLSRTMGAFSRKMIAELMPVFQSLMDWVLANLPTIQTIFGNVFGFIQEIIGWAVEWIQTFIEWMGEWKSGNEEALSGIWAAFQEYLGFLIEYWENIFETAKEIVTEVFEFIVDIIQVALENIYEFWQEHGESILETAVSVFEEVKSVVETVFSTVWEIIQDVLERVSDFIDKTLTKILEFWDENGESIMEIVDTVFSVITDIIEEVMPIIQDIIEVGWGIIEDIFDTAVGVVMGIVETFIGLFTGDFEKMKDGITEIVESLWDGVKGIFEGAWDLISGPITDLGDKLLGWFDDLKNLAFDWGKNMIDGFIDGIKSMGSAVADAAKGVIDSAADFLKFWSPAKKGEGKYITHWGENLVDGFLDGVRNETSEAGQMMNELIRTMNPQEHLNSLLPQGEANELVSRLPSTRIQPSDQTTVLGNSRHESNNVEQLLQELIRAVREGKDIWLNDRLLGSLTEPHITEIQERKKRRRGNFA